MKNEKATFGTPRDSPLLRLVRLLTDLRSHDDDGPLSIFESSLGVDVVKNLRPEEAAKPEERGEGRQL